MKQNQFGGAAKGVSRPPCGGRGLKLERPRLCALEVRRPPCGGRGLKQLDQHGAAPEFGRPPCGGRGLKLLLAVQAQAFSRRPPCGGRGLKRRQARPLRRRVLSPPVRGAWIETDLYTDHPTPCTSPPVRGAWIETTRSLPPCRRRSSPPVRGAWIETPQPVPTPSRSVPKLTSGLAPLRCLVLHGHHKRKGRFFICFTEAQGRGQANAHFGAFSPCHSHNVPCSILPDAFPHARGDDPAVAAITPESVFFSPRPGNRGGSPSICFYKGVGKI